MREIAKDQQLVDPYDYKEISNAMDKILSNGEYREALIKKAAARAKLFDWDNFTDTVLKVYQELQKCT
jgi:glycosyltransferase involved in cell wall biosynthesis